MYEDRSRLVIKALREAKEEAARKHDAATIVTKHENGSQTITTFYKKGKAIWCKMTTGRIETNSRVYKVDSNKPYIRNLGKYWCLDSDHIRAMKAAL